jgi:hypothetical protein
MKDSKSLDFEKKIKENAQWRKSNRTALWEGCGISVIVVIAIIIVSIIAFLVVFNNELGGSNPMH